MPIVGQIQPKFLHPHVATYVNDNTVFEDKAAPAVDDSVKLFYFVTSPRGRDNVFLTHTSHVDWVNEYGKPDVNLYGQAGLMAYSSLFTGLCTVKTMRVMPQNATYSNALISMKVKTDKTDPTNPKLLVKMEVSHSDKAMSADDVLTSLEVLRTTDPDDEGFVTIPIGAVRSLGRGVYGNEYRVRITQSMQMDKENDYKNIKIETIGTTNGIAKLEFFQGALSMEALEGKRSIFIDDIINDIDNGSTHISFTVDPLATKSFYELYKSINDSISEDDIDVFTLLDKRGELLKGVNITEDSVRLDLVEGVPLSGGDDGDFKIASDADGKKLRQDRIDSVLMEAMKGNIDRAVLSRRRVPADVILDCNFSADVKRCLIDLAIKRKSAPLYLDSGLLETIAEVTDWATEMENVSPYLLSKNCQCGLVRDPFTYRPCPVTITYEFATAIPVHIKNKGRHIPFAGEDVVLKSFMPRSLKPMIDADDDDIIEELYTKRVNFYHAISEKVFQRGSQTTAQLKWSDLSEEHNVHELYNIKRTIEDYAAKKTYNFAEVEDRNRFTDDARELFKNKIGPVLRSFDVFFDMNKWEEERSILHCYIGIVFKTIAKRVTVEIDINSRVK